MQLIPMRQIRYTGEIWQNAAVHPDLWQLLREQNLLIEIACGGPPYQVILGVPHHAAPGTPKIAQDWENPKTGQRGRPADESAGLAALAVYTALCEQGLACKLVIAAQPADHDPNKTPGSAYWESIFTQPLPGLLFELHGTANHRKHALELSAGRNAITDPLLYGKVLAYFFNEDPILAVQTQNGSSDGQRYKNRLRSGGRLQTPALETPSLSYAGDLGVQALHLECKPIFRLPDPQHPSAPRPAPLTWRLAQALASTLKIFNRSNEIMIPAAQIGLPSTAFLTRPSLQYEESYMSALKETPLHEMNDNPELRIWGHDGFVYLVEDSRQVNYYGLPEDPPEEYLWLIDQGEFIGRLFFLHWLNDFRLKTDGQVDYWIRPSKRRQGYGRLILRLLLERYRQLGEERVLISCASDNTPSRKIIEANGGVFESEIQSRDSVGYPELRSRFWIDLT
jgi:predicted acetyltransferase